MKNLKIIEAPSADSPTHQPRLFLAGGTTNCPDWQKEILRDILHFDPPISIFNPRREIFPMDDPTQAKIQIEWEYNNLKTADALLFWFARGSINPIALYETCRWANSSDIKLFLGCDPEYERIADVMIQTRRVRPNRVIHESIESLALDVCQYYMSDSGLIDDAAKWEKYFNG